MVQSIVQLIVITNTMFCVCFYVYSIPPNRVLPFGMKDNFWEMGTCNEEGVPIVYTYLLPSVVYYCYRRHRSLWPVH